MFALPDQIVRIPIERLHADPTNAREDVTADMDLLADSIRAHGFLIPLRVRPDGDGFVVVSGHRRLAAARVVGLADVPVVVTDVAEGQAQVEALIENLQRKDLSPVEEARGYDALCARGLSQAEVARSVGVPYTRVLSRLQLLTLPDDVLGHVHTGKLSAPAAVELGKIGHPDVQRRVAALAARASWSTERVRQVVEAEVRKVAAERPPPPVSAGKLAWKETAPNLGRRGDIFAWLDEAQGAVEFRDVARLAHRTCSECGLEKASLVCAQCPMLDFLEQCRPYALAQSPARTPSR